MAISFLQMDNAIGIKHILVVNDNTEMSLAGPQTLENKWQYANIFIVKTVWYTNPGFMTMIMKSSNPYKGIYRK